MTATRRTTNCAAEDREVREEIACILFRAQRANEVGAFGDARAALAPLLRRASMNGAERFHAGRLAFTLAQAEEDEALQAQALRLLLSSGRLAEADHMRAERRLSALTAGVVNTTSPTRRNRTSRIFRARPWPRRAASPGCRP